MHAAVRKNDIGSVEKLLSTGVDIDAVYYGTTPLLVALENGFVDIASWLMDRECDVSRKDAAGKSAFEYAVCNNQIKIVEKLLQHSSDVNARLTSGHTALTYATSKKLLPLVQILLKGGADVSARNGQDETAVFIAAREGLDTVLQCLLQASAASQPTVTDMKPLYDQQEVLGPDTMVTDHSEDRDVDRHMSVMDAVCGGEGWTPLIVSVVNGHLSATKILIKAGCEVNARDHAGWTALWHAVVDGDTRIMKALVAGGGDASVIDLEGRTLMDEAKDLDDSDILDILTHGRS